MNMHSNLKKIIVTSLFAALTCAATMSIRIPTPGTGGYIHPGDAAVILSGVILGPGWGLLAAGIGSALADFLGGYFIYVPITFAVKGITAFTAGSICLKLGRTPKSRMMTMLMSGAADILFVSGGYFLCEIPLYGVSGAAASIPANLIQGISGLILASVLYPVLLTVPDIKQMISESR